MKVVKAYSLDIKTVELLERYPHGKKSELVNEAVKWYCGNTHIQQKIENLEAQIIGLEAYIERLESSKSQGLLRRILSRMLTKQ
jgi:hypothetical protein